MLFRIDLERFLTHMIDHFTREELLNFQYLIIGTISNQGRCDNIVKINDLFPSSETQTTYLEYQDKDVLKKMYYKDLSEYGNLIYNVFIKPIIIQHNNIVIICHEGENVYIDILVSYLDEKFSLKCIDLNELFTTGRVGEMYIDYKKIYNKAVDIRRAAIKDQIKALESTKDGRLNLLSKMNTKDKLKKLKSIGIKVSKSELRDLDKLLIDAWVEDD